MVSLTPVTSANWRDIARVRAADRQRRWVADVTYYLCLSAYDGVWRSCAVQGQDATSVGHVMWAVDPEDHSHWLGGLVIDAEHQGQGLGRATVQGVADAVGERGALDLRHVVHTGRVVRCSRQPGRLGPLPLPGVCRDRRAVGRRDRAQAREGRSLATGIVTPA